MIRELKKQLQSKEGAEGVDEDDLERLQTMYQELRTMLEQCTRSPDCLSTHG